MVLELIRSVFVGGGVGKRSQGHENPFVVVVVLFSFTENENERRAR